MFTITYNQPVRKKGYASLDRERIKFTGQERDLNLTDQTTDDLDYMHARYYAFNIGRFMSVDPVRGTIGSSQSWDRYTYVRDNPINRFDPFGMADQDKKPCKKGQPCAEGATAGQPPSSEPKGTFSGEIRVTAQDPRMSSREQFQLLTYEQREADRTGTAWQTPLSPTDPMREMMRDIGSPHVEQPNVNFTVGLGSDVAFAFAGASGEIGLYSNPYAHEVGVYWKFGAAGIGGFDAGPLFGIVPGSPASLSGEYSEATGAIGVGTVSISATPSGRFTGVSVGRPGLGLFLAGGRSGHFVLWRRR